jgi:hypothetical protein
MEARMNVPALLQLDVNFAGSWRRIAEAEAGPAAEEALRQAAVLIGNAHRGRISFRLAQPAEGGSHRVVARCVRDEHRLMVWRDQ